MGLVRSAVRAHAGDLSSVSTPEKWVVDWVTGGLPVASGVRVDEETALHYSAFWAGIRVISEDVGSLPLITYERLERGKRRATEHPLYPILHDQPNPFMTSVQLRETLQAHALTWGDGVAYKVRDNDGRITELWPLRPDRLQIDVRRTEPRWRPWYIYHGEHGTVVLAAEEVLHIPGLGFDGIHGYSVVHMARNSIGLGLATEHYGSSFFGNGSRPGGVLQHPNAVTEEARKRMKADWENLHRGLDKSQRIAILEEGVTWQQIGIPPEDAQFLETRKLQVTEMARWLRIPPHKLADLERATFSNIESQQIDYLTTALRIWLVRWEQAIKTQLLTSAERSRFFAEHLRDALLQGDTKTRYEAYAIGRNWSWLSPDDIREAENMNPLPEGQGGGTYLAPLNMVPAGQVGQAAEPPRALPRARVRSAEMRRRLMDSYAPRIAEADRRLAEAERDEVARLAEANLDLSTDGFLDSVDAFYADTHRQATTAAWRGLFGELAQAVAVDALADVAGGDEIDLSSWVASYVASHVAHRVGSATGQIRSAVSGADDPMAAVTELLDGWVADRPGRTAQWQSVQLTNGSAREAWRTAGVRRLRWVTVGDNCPFCTRMDGETVDIQAPFIAAGGQVTGLEQVLQVDRDTHHPPIHPGCNCEVVPE